MMNYFPYFVYAAWLASEILLNRMLRSGKQDKKNTDRYSLAIIWFTITMVCIKSVQISRMSREIIFADWH